MNLPTWLDLNEPSIVPPLGHRSAPDLGPVAVMVSTMTDLKRIETAVQPGRSMPFFNGRLVIDSAGGASGPGVAGPFIGSAYAVMLLESLVARGVRQLLMLGWCGSLSSDIQVGDLVVPDQALVDEGTSCNYAALDRENPRVYPHQALSACLWDHLTDLETARHRVPVWTTDAIYRETAKKRNWFRDRGAKVVEMECSALFAAAAFRGIQAAALLVVSDSLSSHTWEPGFKQKRFKQGRHAAREAILAAARSLCIQQLPG